MRSVERGNAEACGGSTAEPAGLRRVSGNQVGTKVAQAGDELAIRQPVAQGINRAAQVSQRTERNAGGLKLIGHRAETADQHDNVVAVVAHGAGEVADMDGGSA